MSISSKISTKAFAASPSLHPPPLPVTDLFSLECHIDGIIEYACDLLSAISFINMQHVNLTLVVVCYQ